jgi:hypothetical protein
VPRAALKAGLRQRREQRRETQRETQQQQQQQQQQQLTVRGLLEACGLGRVGTASARHLDVLVRIAEELRAEGKEQYKYNDVDEEEEEVEGGVSEGGREKEEEEDKDDAQHQQQCRLIRIPPMRTNPGGDQQPSVRILPSVLGPCLAALRSHGIARIPRVFSARTVHALRDHLRRAVHPEINTPDRATTRIVRLQAASGNGKNGLYFYLNHPSRGHDALTQLKKSLATALYDTPQQRAAAIRSTRCIGLGYGKGGENFTHQDQHKLPYQALVLLSEPGTDFTGGELYVEVRGRDEPPTPSYMPASEHTSQFAVGGSAGDVVVFCANGCERGQNNDQRCFHGMTQVFPGTGDVCERWAIGLFHSNG